MVKTNKCIFYFCLAIIENTFVGGDSYDNSVIGKNTGLHKNNVELRHLKILELKEKLGDLLIESQLLEQSLYDNNKLILDFIQLIPSENNRLVMEMTYIDCMTNVEIASTLNYSLGVIDMARSRSINTLIDIILKTL